ncbi:hypothetical protein CLAFUW4_13001 [Fulvia fulva]|uniref:BTB domain-containing protein n=1 Tax=Passalora fulva TaxID=5499 RepID=A0A9Q8UUU7_PASFU|nr:uncharacterized protein CLAFUR5_12863 [Fulvia fulva]KAK4612137.1 hypothetical protein CLAFUR4_13005 [Fulvia fulva]KAK4612433.1 hypothetical protein CLAFUR0_13010 [Fulvia fulva]UJO23349.1 hypothetical protein CLAFUR5_12863 [Fulvia fulva]WPV21128.1 hypothetical protein CLAFUW4_13001 [Fulvia fulva]WPV36371.1 hypothetical protein CLAFUW7_13008 [Fulvia fulva]
MTTPSPDPELSLDQTMTTVLVGAGRRAYHVHKALLCDKLGYFRAAYNTPMQEATGDTFKIEDISEFTFGLVVKWLYTGKIYLADGEHEVVPTSHGENKNPEADYESDGCGSEASGGSECEKANTRRDSRAGTTANETEVEVDYEYESGSELSDTEVAARDSITTDSTEQEQGILLKHASAASYETFEQHCIRAVFPDAEARNLDTYQLDVLIRFYEHTAAYEQIDDLRTRYAEVLSKLKIRQETLIHEPTLPQVHTAEADDDDDVYDILADLYILADCFDSTELKRVTLKHASAEFVMRVSTLHTRLLPTFQTVGKAFENLPKASDFRKWLLYVFSRFWRPSGDSPGQVLERDDLRKDFTTELMLVIAERCYWENGSYGTGHYKYDMMLDTDGQGPEKETSRSCDEAPAEASRLRRANCNRMTASNNGA